MLLSNLGRTDVAININRLNKEFVDVVSVADVAIVRFVVSGCSLSQVHHDHLLLDEIVHDRNGYSDAISWNINAP